MRSVINDPVGEHYWELEVLFRTAGDLPKRLGRLSDALRGQHLLHAKMYPLYEKCDTFCCAFTLGLRGVSMEGMHHSIREALGKDVVSLKHKLVSQSEFSRSKEPPRYGSLDEAGWAVLLQSLAGNFGTGALSAIHSTGLEIGASKGRELAQLHAREDWFMLLMKGLDALQSSGWGKYQLLKTGTLPHNIEVRIFENLECKAAMSVHPFENSFTRGYITGLLRSLLSDNIMVREERCIRKGDCYCSYVVE